ncbi:hypothetical protein JW711_05170 [Candidatus Woesearchaeota archaeon]|nr:hypothetical protein [Candidatus Woesearchaeota archaeon]
MADYRLIFVLTFILLLTASLVSAGKIEDSLRDGESKTYEINGAQFEITVIFIEMSDPSTVKLLIDGIMSPPLHQGDYLRRSDGVLLGVVGFKDIGGRESSVDIEISYLDYVVCPGCVGPKGDSQGVPEFNAITMMISVVVSVLIFLHVRKFP